MREMELKCVFKSTYGFLFALKRAGFWTQQLNWVWEVTKEIVCQGPDTRAHALLLPNNCLGKGEGLEDPLCL